MENTRISDYKCIPDICSQEKRRLDLLKEQKRQRELSIESHRALSHVFKEEEYTSSESRQYLKGLNKKMLMKSEWMLHVPQDLIEKWMFVLCPTGQHCLVVASSGCTKVCNRNKKVLKTFSSWLPAGNRRHGTGSHWNDVTVLDCIMDHKGGNLYVLDVLYWKGQSYMDTDVSFRHFWIKSKFSEQNSQTQPFVLLEFHPCEVGTLTRKLSEFPAFSYNQPVIDGVLFYHTGGFYKPGPDTTPLVVWLKPFMVPEQIDDVSVATQYYENRPDNYTNIQAYIDEFNHKEQLRRAKKKRRVGQSNEVEMEDKASLELEQSEDANREMMDQELLKQDEIDGEDEYEEDMRELCLLVEDGAVGMSLDQVPVG